jgi:hypothetical protein
VSLGRNLGNNKESPAFMLSVSLKNAAAPQAAQVVSVKMGLPSNNLVGTCEHSIYNVLQIDGTISFVFGTIIFEWQ